MKNYLLLKYLIVLLREYIFIFLTATIFSIIPFSEILAKENVFIVDNIIDKSEMVVIENAGHMMMIEKPMEITQIIHKLFR